MTVSYRCFQDKTIAILGNDGILEQAIRSAFQAEDAHVYSISLDASGASSCPESEVRAVFEKHRRLDIFIAVPPKENRDDHLLEMEPGDWKRTVSNPLEQFAASMVAAASFMKDSGGVLLAVCSGIAAETGIDRNLGTSLLHHSVCHFMRAAAIRLAGYRIRSQVLTYGGLEDCPEQAAEIPQGRLGIQSKYLSRNGSAKDVAEAALFLCSDDAELMTGSQLNVDGGIGVGINIYSGKISIGNAIYERMLKTGVTRFDGVVSGSREPSVENAPLEITLKSAVPATAQVVLLTGVSKGLGYALCERLIAEGHTVLGCARSPGAIEELKRKFGDPHRFEVVDLTDRERVVFWAESLKQDGYVPDFLINNAATAGEASTLVWKHAQEDFEQVFRINVLSTVNTIHAFMPNMLRRMKGVIVNFSSGWGREAAPKVGPYAVSKWGIEGLSRVLAAELPNKMACVSLHPGIIHTESMARTFGRSAKNYPTPQEWAKVAAPFLMSITPPDNGKAISVPGMTEFKGMG